MCLSEFRPIFRSYKPHDEKLKESIKETSLPVEVADNVKEMLAQAAPEPIVDEVVSLVFVIVACFMLQCQLLHCDF